LTKGRLIYIEGRLHTRSWESNGQKQYKTEIVASDMLILDQKPAGPSQAGEHEAEPEPVLAGVGAGARRSSQAGPAAGRGRPAPADEVDLDDIPF
jgi:single-strand DNA-binding protein